MSNSPLISFTKISPYRTSPRNHVIDTITPHCYVGNVSAEDAAAWFSSAGSECSCNYFIDKDGRIALIVPEGDRSWCSSNRDNDNRAITIECASDKAHPFAVNDKVYASLVSLCTDICKRNHIERLKWQGDKTLVGQVDKQNMTAHRWFANKACPGDYLYSRYGAIAAEVNKRLGASSQPEEDIRKTVIGDTTVNEISKVVYGEAGIIRSYDALLAAAQCVHDMWKSGKFGKTLTEVMQKNFSAYGSKETTNEAIQAVYDVFCKSKRRFPNAQILQFRSFTKYSDGNGNMDRNKCASLLDKYQYLGKDSRDNRWGHLYFGNKNKTSDKENKPVDKIFNEYMVRIKIPDLRIREEPTIHSHSPGCIPPGSYTIIDEKQADGYTWGKLKSGAGWIALKYASRI